MIESRKFVAVAILFGLALIMAGLMLTPSNGRAAASAGTDAINARIGDSFAMLSNRAADPALAAAAERVQKGDLARAADCAVATWPNVDAACLKTVDGRPAHAVRTITIGYQADANTTVLTRIPAAEIAQR